MNRRIAVSIAALAVFGCLAWAAPKITLIHYHWTESAYDPIWQKAAKAFEAKHPDVEVKLVFVPDGDRANVIRTILASKGSIDSMALSNSEIAEFVEAGQVIPLIPKSFGKGSADEVAKMWVPGAMDATGARVNGAYYGIPVELSNFVAWVNTAYMKEAGLDPKKDIPKTWDEFAALGQKLVKKEGGVVVRNGFMNNSKLSTFNVNVLFAMMEQLGLDWGSDAGIKASLDQPDKLARVLRTYTDFVAKSKIWDPGLGENDRDGFGNGKSAMFLTGGSWYWGTLASYSVKPADVEPFPYPRFKDGLDIGGIGYGKSLFVSKLSKHPDLAFELLDFLASYPTEFAEKGLYQPRLKLSNGAPGLDQSVVKKNVPYYEEVFGPELAKTGHKLTSVKYSQVNEAAWDAISRVIYEGTPVEDSVAKMQAQIRSIYK